MAYAPVFNLQHVQAPKVGIIYDSVSNHIDFVYFCLGAHRNCQGLIFT